MRGDGQDGAGVDSSVDVLVSYVGGVPEEVEWVSTSANRRRQPKPEDDTCLDDEARFSFLVVSIPTCPVLLKVDLKTTRSFFLPSLRS